MNFDFDYDTLTRYTEGDCWLLASVLVDDFNLGQFVTTEYSDTDPGQDWFHVAIAIEDGRILDINGIQTVEEFHEVWGGEILYPDSIKQSLFHYDATEIGDGSVPNWELAYKTAQDILSMIGAMV